MLATSSDLEGAQKKPQAKRKYESDGRAMVGE